MADSGHTDRLRREARLLLGAVRSGEHTALERAANVLGSRLHARFVLADALHVLAREQGATSWPALVRRHRRGPIRAGLDDARDSDGVAEIDVETSLHYPDGEPVTIRVRRREGSLCLLDDCGGATTRAGRRHGWLDAAERAVRRSGMNVSRTGVVFVGANEHRDLEALALRLAQASLDVLEALVELDDSAPARG
jgi:hypothetical protein